MLSWIYVQAPRYFVTSGKKGGIVPFHSSFGLHAITLGLLIPRIKSTYATEIFEPTS